MNGNLHNHQIIFIEFKIENPFQAQFNNSYNADGQLFIGRLIRISLSPRKLKRNRISKTKIYEFDSIWIHITWFEFEMTQKNPEWVFGLFFWSYCTIFFFISAYCIFIRIMIIIMTNNDHMIACYSSGIKPPHRWKSVIYPNCR